MYILYDVCILLIPTPRFFATGSTVPTFSILAGNGICVQITLTVTYIILFLFIYYLTESFTQDEVNDTTEKPVLFFTGPLILVVGNDVFMVLS